MNPGRGDYSRSGARLLVRDPQRLAVLMALSGVGRRRLATAAGWRSHGYLLRLLSGDARTVGSDAAVRIAGALGVGVDELFTVDATSIPGHGDRGVEVCA